jgi:hypothetical protein
MFLVECKFIYEFIYCSAVQQIFILNQAILWVLSSLIKITNDLWMKIT